MTDLAHDFLSELPRRSAPPTSPHLRVVEAPARRRRPRLAYGVVAVAGAVAIALTQMVLSILTTQGTYEIAALTQQQRELTYEKQMLNDDVAGLSSPQFLAANAAALGMVINESPSYLRLSDGAIVGSGQPAVDGSNVDAMGRASVRNALIADTPLVTAPDATIQGTPLTIGSTGPETDTGLTTPQPITDGLPTPATR